MLIIDYQLVEKMMILRNTSKRYDTLGSDWKKESNKKHTKQMQNRKSTLLTKHHSSYMSHFLIPYIVLLTLQN